MSEDVLLVREADGIVTLTLNRPEVMNSLNFQLLFALRDAVESVRFRRDIRVIIIAAVGGAAGAGLGVPMMIAFIIGLLISNSVIVVVTATGFVASQLRQRIYVAIGVVAGAFSIVVGLLFLLQAEQVLPDLDSILGFIGS